MRLNHKVGEGRSISVFLPASKSIALRAEILAAIFSDKVLVDYTPDNDDCLDLSLALNELSSNREDAEGHEYYLGNGAAPLRFFTAYASSLGNFNGIITCSEQLKKRPMAPLVDALRSGGVDIECLEREGYPPLHVRGKNIAGIEGKFGCDVSSQFTSALMMASLVWAKPYKEPYDDSMVSRPYVEMTGKMIDAFVKLSDSAIETPSIYKIESDWSSASYFYELAMLLPGLEIHIENLTEPEKSLQGDSACAEIFENFGVQTKFYADGSAVIKGDNSIISHLAAKNETICLNLSDTPDLVPAVVVGLCLRELPFIIEGIGHLRYKESDRISSLVLELSKAGYVFENKSNALAWLGHRIEPATHISFDSHNDHRIAMALAVSVVKLGEIEITNAECVSKSFPDFYNQLKKIGLETDSL